MCILSIASFAEGRQPAKNLNALVILYVIFMQYIDNFDCFGIHWS